MFSSNLTLDRHTSSSGRRRGVQIADMTYRHSNFTRSKPCMRAILGLAPPQLLTYANLFWLIHAFDSMGQNATNQPLLAQRDPQPDKRASSYMHARAILVVPLCSLSSRFGADHKLQNRRGSRQARELLATVLVLFIRGQQDVKQLCYTIVVTWSYKALVHLGTPLMLYVYCILSSNPYIYDVRVL